MESAEKRNTTVVSNSQVNGGHITTGSSVQRGQLVVPKNAPWSIVTTGQQIAQPVYDAMRESILRIRQETLSARNLAYEVLEFFTILVRHETGLISPRRGLSICLDKLCAGRAWSSLAMGILRWAEKSISNHASVDLVEQGQVERDLEMFLDWYSLRSLSIDRLLPQTQNNLNYDQLFKVEVLHDHYQQSCHGFVVQLGLALFGRAHQNLWLKVFLISDGEYVLPRPGWDSWVDDTEIFSLSHGRSSPYLSSNNSFAAIVPIVPETQRAILDNINVFVPYSALDLPADKQEVELEVALYNERGERLIRATAHEVMSVVPHADSGYKMLSYQAQGLWPEDASKGFALRNIFSSLKETEVKKKKQFEVEVSIDLDMSGEPGQEYFIEVRCMHCDKDEFDGELVASKVPEYKDASVITKVPVTLERPILCLRDFEIKFPFSALQLDGSEEQLLVEICLVDAYERVQCGSLSLLPISEKAQASVEIQKNKNKIGFVKVASDFVKDVVGIRR
jgi:hypothetical protein